jgi:hypothetical protein
LPGSRPNDQHSPPKFKSNIVISAAGVGHMLEREADDVSQVLAR